MVTAMFIFAGNRLAEPISCMAVDNAFVFVGSGKEIFAFVHGRQVTLSTKKLLISLLVAYSVSVKITIYTVCVQGVE